MLEGSAKQTSAGSSISPTKALYFGAESVICRLNRLLGARKPDEVLSRQRRLEDDLDGDMYGSEDA